MESTQIHSISSSRVNLLKILCSRAKQSDYRLQIFIITEMKYLYSTFRYMEHFQKDLPVSLNSQSLYFSYYPTRPWQPQQKLYMIQVRPHFYWSFMADGVCTTVNQCQSCAQCGVQTKHKTKLYRFTSSERKNLITIDILDPSLKTKRCKVTCRQWPGNEVYKGLHWLLRLQQSELQLYFRITG